MAKQKKKKKKIKRKELPKKDKILYFITSNIPTAVIFVLSILGYIYFKKIINKINCFMMKIFCIASRLQTE